MSASHFLLFDGAGCDIMCVTEVLAGISLVPKESSAGGRKFHGPTDLPTFLDFVFGLPAVVHTDVDTCTHVSTISRRTTGHFGRSLRQPGFEGANTCGSERAAPRQAGLLIDWYSSNTQILLFWQMPRSGRAATMELHHGTSLRRQPAAPRPAVDVEASHPKAFASSARDAKYLEQFAVFAEGCVLGRRIWRRLAGYGIWYKHMRLYFVFVHVHVDAGTCIYHTWAPCSQWVHAEWRTKNSRLCLYAFIHYPQNKCNQSSSRSTLCPHKTIKCRTTTLHLAGGRRYPWKDVDVDYRCVRSFWGRGF